MTQKNDIVIEKAKKSDLTAIKKLLAELINAMDYTEGIDVGVALETCEQLLNDVGSHFLMATAQEAPVGFIHFTIRQTVLHRGPSATIDEIVVTKEYREKGVGKQLVLATIERCKRLGCCEIEVSTEKTNDKARKFYKKCGFEERGILFEAEL